MRSISKNPFADGAMMLQASDWGDPLVLRPDTKQPMLNGWTGYSGASPTDGQVQQLIVDHPSALLGLRLSHGLVGFDNDDDEGRSWSEFEQRHGEQEPTWTVTARGPDSVRRTHLYRLPEGTSTHDWRDAALMALGGGIDLLRYAHRHQVWPPSPHETIGLPYVLYDPDRQPFTGSTLPPVADLPVLSDEWVMHMDTDCACFYVAPEVKAERAAIRHQMSTVPQVGLRKGAITMVNRMCDALAGLEPDTGRNNMLNRDAFNVFVNLVLAEGSLTVLEVVRAFTAAGKACDLKDGEIDRTLQSAWGMALIKFKTVA